MQIKQNNENELNEITEKVKPILSKGLTKDLINKSSILNGAKHFYSGIFLIQNYFALCQLKIHQKICWHYSNLFVEI